jgi:FtsZ-interacting cell division protein ZipA
MDQAPDNTVRNLLIVAIVLALCGILVGAFGYVKAKDAKEVAQANTGQQSALSSTIDQRLSNLENQGRKEIKRAETTIRTQERSAERSVSKETAKAMKANRAQIDSINSEVASLSKKVSKTNGRITQGNVATEARLEQLEAQVRKLQKQINSVLP